MTADGTAYCNIFGIVQVAILPAYDLAICIDANAMACRFDRPFLPSVHHKQTDG
jgi:hypothetical protein